MEQILKTELGQDGAELEQIARTAADGQYFAVSAKRHDRGRGRDDRIDIPA
ncbi:hypothetical protein [Massilia eurypsychrophila]|uniref:hypothetical protein n=1 Tax=Massilia eurypsychrophila TaxID=1485217 RepID=UPI001E3E83FA|nr:hypothetical protein [Massilia eurypsychrophila]